MELSKEIEAVQIITSGDPTTAPFDPRKFPATYAGYLKDGTLARGLKMPDSTFTFLVYDLPAGESDKVRKQIDLAEAAGLRKYRIFTSRGYYDIENGIPSGSGR